jgi:DNA-binding XRE family transcriptional regulator
MPRLTLAERFLITRRRAKLNQSEMARLLGVTRETVNRAENGRRISKSVQHQFRIVETRVRQIRRDKDGTIHELRGSGRG